MNEEFEKLKEAVDRLHDLLHDPHPGLSSWCLAVAKCGQDIQEFFGAERS